VLAVLAQRWTSRTLALRPSLWVDSPDSRAIRPVLMALLPREIVVPDTLARIIRSKLEDGTLPCEEPNRLRAGIGSGEPCTACERPIPPSQTEYEPQYNNRATIRLHLGCHGLWEAERRRRRDDE